MIIRILICNTKMKTNQEIVEYLYKEGIVRKFIENTTKTNMKFNQHLFDFEQDVYLIVLEMDNTKLNDLFNKNELNFYIARIIVNQIKSTTSPYFLKYIKFNRLSEEIGFNIINKDKYDNE